jgi:phosphatidylserine decarboxylase
MIAKGCWHVVFVSFFVCILMGLGSFFYYPLVWSSVVFFAAGLFFLIFFRDPERSIGKGIVSAADGVVMEVGAIGKSLCIKTFMNIHNVHVNRMPIGGVVKGVKHFPGSYVPACGKDSDRNERVEMVVDTVIGNIKVVQIAGLVARRIVCYLKKGQRAQKGQRIGIIRLGSRVDVYFPKNRVRVAVKPGDRIKAGETTIAFVKK